MKIRTVVKMFQLKDKINEYIGSAKADDGKVDLEEMLGILYALIKDINEILEQEGAR